MSAAYEWLAHRQSTDEAAPNPRNMAQIPKSETIDAAQSEAAVIVQVAGL
jgi:hypothetical protein